MGPRRHRSFPDVSPTRRLSSIRFGATLACLALAGGLSVPVAARANPFAAPAFLTCGDNSVVARSSGLASVPCGFVSALVGSVGAFRLSNDVVDLVAPRGFLDLSATGGQGSYSFDARDMMADASMLAVARYDSDYAVVSTSAIPSVSFDAPVTVQGIPVPLDPAATAVGVGPVGSVAQAPNLDRAPLTKAAAPGSSEGAPLTTKGAADHSSGLFTSTYFDLLTFYGSASNSVTLYDRTRGDCVSTPRASRRSRSKDRYAGPCGPVEARRTWRVWASGFAGAGGGAGDFSSVSVNRTDSVVGGALGLDYQITPHFLLGLAVGSSDAGFASPQQSTIGNANGGHVALYSLATLGPAYLASSVTGSTFQNEQTHVVERYHGFVGGSQIGVLPADEVRGRVEIGRRFTLPVGGELTPFVAMEAADQRGDHFAQVPSDVRHVPPTSVVEGHDSLSLPAFAGLRYRHLFALAHDVTFAPIAQAAYVHDFQDQGGSGMQSAPPFAANGQGYSPNSVRLKLAGELYLGERTLLFASLDSGVSLVSHSYRAQAGLSVRW